jgi:hypothetical protein
MIDNKAIELRDIVYYYTPLFIMAFSSQDNERQDYTTIAFTILESRYTNFDDLNEAVFLVLDQCLKQAGKAELLRNQFQDLQLIYAYLNKASDKLKEYLKYKSAENEAVAVEFETIIDLLKRDQQPTAATLLENIVVTYKEDSEKDFLIFQAVMYGKVLEQIELRKDLKAMFN